MRNIKKTLIAALLIGTASVGTASIGTVGAANAAVGIGIDIGDVAIGYSDGYYDSHHRWHRWAHPSDMQQWRAGHADSYHDWRHDDRHHH